MKLRSFIAFLVLANYLLLTGMGCISRTEQDTFMVLIQTRAAESQHYEACRYLRTNALETFMAEALATDYKESSDSHSPHILSVIVGVDAHFLPEISVASFTGSFFEKPAVFNNHEAGSTRTMAFAIDAPPQCA